MKTQWLYEAAIGVDPRDIPHQLTYGYVPFTFDDMGIYNKEDIYFADTFPIDKRLCYQHDKGTVSAYTVVKLPIIPLCAN